MSRAVGGSFEDTTGPCHEREDETARRKLKWGFAQRDLLGELGKKAA